MIKNEDIRYNLKIEFQFEQMIRHYKSKKISKRETMETES